MLCFFLYLIPLTCPNIILAGLLCELAADKDAVEIIEKQNVTHELQGNILLQFFDKHLVLQHFYIPQMNRLQHTQQRQCTECPKISHLMSENASPKNLLIRYSAPMKM